MNETKQVATADAGDRHQTLAALAALSIALMFATRAAMHLVDPWTAEALDVVTIGFAWVGVALLVPMIYWKVLKLPRAERHIYFSDEGFVAEVLRRAQKVSWAVTFFLLIGLEMFVGAKGYDGYWSTLPPEFFLQVVLAAMLGVMATVFLVLSRGEGAEEAIEVDGRA